MIEPTKDMPPLVEMAQELRRQIKDAESNLELLPELVKSFDQTALVTKVPITKIRQFLSDEIKKEVTVWTESLWSSLINNSSIDDQFEFLRVLIAPEKTSKLLDNFMEDLTFGEKPKTKILEEVTLDNLTPIEESIINILKSKGCLSKHIDSVGIKSMNSVSLNDLSLLLEINKHKVDRILKGMKKKRIVDSFTYGRLGGWYLLDRTNIKSNINVLWKPVDHNIYDIIIDILVKQNCITIIKQEQKDQSYTYNSLPKPLLVDLIQMQHSITIRSINKMLQNMINLGYLSKRRKGKVWEYSYNNQSTI